eukprot:Rhum_TRINITY_DN13599_c0_g1::Rhum_TRINITY_DN13599_c0_g1_i1::g.61616::m.61616
MGFRHEGLVSPTGSAFDYGDDLSSRPPAVVDRPFAPLHNSDGPVPPGSAASVKGKFVRPPSSSRWCAPVHPDSSPAEGGAVGDVPASSSALFHHQARRGSLGAPPAPPCISHSAAAAEAASFYPPAAAASAAAVDVWNREAPPPPQQQQTRHVSPDAHAPETSHVSPARRPEWDNDDADPMLPAAPSPHHSPPPALCAPVAAVSSAAMAAATASAASAALAVGGGCDLQMQSEIVSLRSQVSELRSLVTSIIADKTEEKVEQAMLLRGFDPHAAGLALCHGGGVSPRAAPPGPSVSPRPAVASAAAAAAVAAAAAPAPPPPLPQHLAYTGPSDVSVAARLRAQQHGGQAPLSAMYEGGGALRDAVGERRAAAAAAAAAAASHKPVTDYTPPVRGYGGGGAGSGGYGAGGHGRPTLESMYPVPPVAGLNSSRPVSEVLARRRSAEYEPRGGPTGPVRGEDGLTVVERLRRRHAF